MFVDYGVAKEPWHERYVYAVLENKHCVVITPDYDVYVDVLQVGKGLYRNLRMCAAGARALPADLGVARGQPVYRFNTHIIPTKTMAAAKKLFDKEKGTPRLPLQDGDAGGDDDGGDEPSDEEEESPDEEEDFQKVVDEAGKRVGGRWIIVGGSLAPAQCGEPAIFADNVKFARFEFDCGYMLSQDDTVQLVEWWPDPKFNEFARLRTERYHEVDGNKTPRGGPTPKDAKKGDGGGDDDEEPEAEDARTLPVLWSASGYRARAFPEAARMLEVSEMDEKDFPLDGPRSSSWFLTSMANSGTTPLLRHSRWVSESGVGADSRSGHEHSILSHILEKAVCIDQLNVVNLVSLEIVVRRLVLLEEAHSIDPGQPSFEGWEHWLGLGERRAGILVPPELSRHVARKVGDESAVQKERRKAKEERRFTKKDKTHPKGDGKGKKGDDS